MQIFKVNSKISVICEFISTRSGFKHVAHLMYYGCERGSVKVCYLNRTWERFQYESVLLKLYDAEMMEDRDQKLFKKFIAKYR
jgi:hypothetical protein